MSWKEEYLSKKTTAEEAVKHIKSKDTVVLGHVCAMPFKLVETMVANKDQYEDVEVVHLLSLGKAEYTGPEMKGHFKHRALFVGGSTRGPVNEGRAEYVPCFFHEVPSFFTDGTIDIDVTLIQVSTPDEDGYCSYGVAVDYTKPAAENAKIVIAEINDQMPTTYGDAKIHISDIDHIVDVSYPIFELPLPKIGEIEKKIGENCAQLVEDGSTLQLGIGAIPDAVLMFLKDKKDLGIHSEMLSDGIVDLYNEGIVTNQMKSINKGKMVATFLLGSKKLYDFVDKNESIEMRPVNYVNNPTVIMQNHKMVSINSCLEVDLMGQVSSESMGLTQFSGVGGQVDYVRGASMAKNGKSIIAMPSTASGGKVSRISATLKEGTAITTSRNDVNYIVTEYGIAKLRGKSLQERGAALIKIAHPDFRDELIKEWETRFKTEYK